MQKARRISKTWRLSPDLIRRLLVASERLHAPSATKIVERGIELALRELEKKPK